MQRLEHDKLSTFGIGREHEKSEWQSIFRQLVVANLFVVDAGDYGSLKITPEGQQFLKAKTALHLRKLPKATPTKSKRSKWVRVPSARPVTYDPFHRQWLESVKYEDKPGCGIHAAPAAHHAEELFRALRSMRQELADEQNVPRYVIFHDKVLLEIAARRPPRSVNYRRSVASVKRSSNDTAMPCWKSSDGGHR